MTSAIRRNSPMHVDSKIHHNNLINNILAKIQANHAGVDSALMLDNLGFISEMNGTNIFMVKNGDVAHANSRRLSAWNNTRIGHGIGVKRTVWTVEERNISLTELVCCG